MSKLKAALIIAIAAASATIALVFQHQAQLKLREENQALRQQLDELAPLTTENSRLSNRLAQAESQPAAAFPPPPTPQAAAPSAPANEEMHGTNLIALILSGKEAP